MKLATQVFLLIVSVLLIAVVAMGAFFAFNLERGFVGYINAIQTKHLDALHQAVSRDAQRVGSLEPLLRDRRLWNRFVRETEGGNVPSDPESWQRPPPPEGRPTPGPEGRPPRPGPDGRPPRPLAGRPAPPPAPDALGLVRRFALLDAERRPMPGDAVPPPGQRVPVERAIQIDGRTIGWIRHYPFERVSRPEELAFLREQFSDIALVALALTLLGLLAAPFVARRWTRPLREIGSATERIAKGEFTVRLPQERGDEIGALMKYVNAMAESLSELEAARKRWIAESAHELRTPLAVLRGEIEALQDGVRIFDAKSLASLAEESRHLTKLVNDLHQLALADLEGLPCVMTRVDARALVKRVAERFESRAAQRGLDLAVTIAPGAMDLDADDDRLEQLLANLLENSLRYTDRPGRVVVSLMRNGHTLRITVEDSAPGVEESACARLFEPLYRADAARSRREGGSGLGLAICRAIAKAHGGSIVARPSALGGLAVITTLPLKP